MSDANNNKTPEDSRESLEKAAFQDCEVQDVHAQLMREKDEPHEGMNPVPLLLIFAFGVLCIWAGAYFMRFSGDFSAEAYSPDFRAGGVAAAAAPEISLPDRGAKVFRAQCAQCHQTNGVGVAGVFPPLAGSDWVTGHSEKLARILINGLNGPIEVLGESYNGNMPAFGPNGLNLRPKEIAGVMTYIRQEWGNTASEVSVEAVEAYLELYASRSGAWQYPAVADGLGDDLAGVVAVAAPVEEAAPAALAE